MRDINGFSGYAGVIVEIVNKKLHFINNLGKENPIPVSDTIPSSATKKSQVKQINFLPAFFTGRIILAIVVIIGILILRKKSR